MQEEGAKLVMGLPGPCSRVYFLYKGEELRRIGKTSAVWPTRILDHLPIKRKNMNRRLRVTRSPSVDFDSYCYINVPPDKLDATERAMILKYRPPDNKEIYLRPHKSTS